MGEHLGYRRLTDEDKERIVPILEIGQRKHETDFDGSMALVRETIGDRPFILDVSKEPLPPPTMPRNPNNLVEARARFEEASRTAATYNDNLRVLLNPTDGFAAWRHLVARFPHAVPVIQFTDAAAQARSLLRQAALLSRGGQSIALRITQDHGDAIYAAIPQIISILDSPEQLLIIIDSGYSRRGIEQQSTFVIGAVGRIIAGIDLLEEFCHSGRLHEQFVSQCSA